MDPVIHQADLKCHGEAWKTSLHLHNLHVVCPHKSQDVSRIWNEPKMINQSFSQALAMYSSDIPISGCKVLMRFVNAM